MWPGQRREEKWIYRTIGEKGLKEGNGLGFGRRETKMEGKLKRGRLVIT